MKNFTITKVGYSRGTYGCSGEYFIMHFTTPEGLDTLTFHGLYGAEQRVAAAMKSKGYQESYSSVAYGQLKGEDRTWSGWKSETEAINIIKELQ